MEVDIRRLHHHRWTIKRALVTLAIVTLIGCSILLLFSYNLSDIDDVVSNVVVARRQLRQSIIPIELLPSPRLLLETETEEYSLFPFTWSDFWGYLSASIGLMIAAGGGIGGGGILVPIYILVMKFTPKHAIPLSNITVFGGAIANTMLNVRKRHPAADRPLVDWDLILVMEPLTIMGALIGTLLNKVLPEAFLVVMLVCLLSATAYNTLKKANKMYAKESLDGRKIIYNELEMGGVEDEFSVDGGEYYRGGGGGGGGGVVMEVEMTRRGRSLSFSDVDMLDSPKELVPPRRKRSLSTSAMDVEKLTYEFYKLKEFPPKNNHSNNPNPPRSQEQTPPNGNNQTTITPTTNGGLHARLKKMNSTTAYDHLHEDDESLYDVIDFTEPKDPIISPSHDHDVSYFGPRLTATPQSLALEQILMEERHAPKSHICLLVLMFIVVLLINVFKGGGAFTSPLGIQCGSTAFWLAEILTFVWIFAISYVARRYLVERTREKSLVGYKYVEGDIIWDERTTVIYPAFCALAGFFAGMFGVGGGIVKGPLMLAMGVHPAVASATSACMILFTSSTATTSFVVFGLLLPDYAALCVFVGFSSTLLGQTIMTCLLRRYKRNSYIAYSIGFVVLLSAICMTVESVVSMSHSGARQHGTLCDVGE